MPDTKPEPTPPKFIYLQDEGQPLEHLQEVTWCADPIDEADTKYIRFDEHESALTAALAAKEAADKRIAYLESKAIELELYIVKYLEEVERRGDAERELAALRADALRWRFVRNTPSDNEWIIGPANMTDGGMWEPDELDAAVDAALRAEPGAQGGLARLPSGEGR